MKTDYHIYLPVRQRQTFLIVLFLIGLVLEVTVIGSNFRSHDMGTTTERINRIEHIINDLRAAVDIDSVRQANIQRVMKLLECYNPAMSSSLKYEIADEVFKMSVKYVNLDVDLICATITHESAGTWDPKVISEAGAMGLMQIMPATGVFLAEYEGLTWTTPENILYNSTYNIRMGTRHLSDLIDLYGVDGGLAAYNGGEKRAAMWLAHNKADGILWAETQTYVPAVLRLYQQFRD